MREQWRSARENSMLVPVGRASSRAETKFDSGSIRMMVRNCCLELLVRFPEIGFTLFRRTLVMIRVYADESETEATSICGYITTSDYWKEFARKWKKILRDFNAPYFHFREFTTKELYSKAGNVYYGWSEKRGINFCWI